VEQKDERRATHSTIHRIRLQASHRSAVWGHWGQRRLAAHFTHTVGGWWWCGLGPSRGAASGHH